MSRECEKMTDGSGRWKLENKFKCIRKDIQEVFETVSKWVHNIEFRFSWFINSQKIYETKFYYDKTTINTFNVRYNDA